MLEEVLVGFPVLILKHNITLQMRRAIFPNLLSIAKILHLWVQTSWNTLVVVDGE